MQSEATAAFADFQSASPSEGAPGLLYWDYQVLPVVLLDVAGRYRKTGSQARLTNHSSPKPNGQTFYMGGDMKQREAVARFGGVYVAEQVGRFPRR